MGKDKLITEEEWIKAHDYVAAVADDRLIGMKYPIFTSGIRVSQYLRRTGNPTEDPFGGGCRMLRASDFEKMQMAFRIEFECCGAGAPAFFEEFMKLVDKYNHWEQSVYLRPQPPKPTFWQKQLKRLSRKKR